MSNEKPKLREAERERERKQQKSFCILNNRMCQEHEILCNLLNQTFMCLRLMRSIKVCNASVTVLDGC